MTFQIKDRAKELLSSFENFKLVVSCCFPSVGELRLSITPDSSCVASKLVKQIT
jgi:hypothetical protein